MPAWLFGLAITLLVGAAATAYLWLIRRRDDETAAGLLALAGMRWRDFSRLVLEAMELRGLVRIPSAHEENQEHSSSFMLGGEGRRQLLACKHGSAYRIGSAAVDEFASEIRLRGAQGGILVTEGVLDKDGLEKAERHNIEIIDGPRLWPTVKPMVEGKLQRRITGNASARARRHIAIAWLGSVTLGLATALVFPSVLNPAQRVRRAAPAAVAADPHCFASRHCRSPPRPQQLPQPRRPRYRSRHRKTSRGNFQEAGQDPRHQPRRLDLKIHP